MDRPDCAWKFLLTHRLPGVLLQLFPEIHALIDWAHNYYIPDKNLPPATADNRTGEREPDFVAIVSLHNGRQACIHVEVQCTRQARFAERMELYHARLRDRFDMQVFSLAILGDPSPTWRPDSTFNLFNGCGTTFRFAIVKLLDLRDRLDSLLNEQEQISLGIAIHLIGIATRRKPELRFTAKRRLLRTLHEKHIAKRELNELHIVLDWMLPLPKVWQRRIVMDIEEFILEHESLDKNSLNYLIPELLLRRCKKLAEEEGRAKGEAEGRVEGQCQTLKLQLESRFGPLPVRLAKTLANAQPMQLERLAVVLLDADSAKQALNAAGLRV